MRRVSVRAILLLIFASCIFGVLTYASVKVSQNRNAFEAAFTDLKNIFGSRPSERHPTITAPLRSSKGVDFQKPVIDASIGVGTVYAPESQGWNANSITVQPPSSVVGTRPADLPIGMTEDDSYRIAGATAPFHSSSNEPVVTARPGRSAMGSYGMGATPLSGPTAYPGSTASAGSASGANVNPGNCCVPCVKAVPESSWMVLVGTALAFSVFWWATRAIRTWLSRRRRAHS